MVINIELIHRRTIIMIWGKYMYNIRFSKLHFYLEMVEDCVLPPYKVSALRGGIGQMLLQQNCVIPAKHKECSSCSFVNSCIVQNIMYAPFKIKPEFQVNHESMGYIIDCTDLRREYKEGEQLKIVITLFGDTISQFMPVVYAITSLGMCGLGKEHALFRVARIENRYHHPILNEGSIDMSVMLIETLKDYVDQRMEKSEPDCTVQFISPCMLKHAGEEQKSFFPEAVIASLTRRLYMYNMFEGIGMDKPKYDRERLPQLISETSIEKMIPRYSTTVNKKMILKGIQGSMTIGQCDDDMLALLYAGEIIHVGKNVHFGFGNMRVR